MYQGYLSLVLLQLVLVLGGHGRLTDATIDRQQNFFGVEIRQNTIDLVAMKSAAFAALIHVASSKINNWHYPHRPTGASGWCKFNSVKGNSTNTYKPGPGLPLEVVYKSDLCLRTSQKMTSFENVFTAKHKMCPFNEKFK